MRALINSTIHLLALSKISVLQLTHAVSRLSSTSRSILEAPLRLGHSSFSESHPAGRVLCKRSYSQPRVQEGTAVVGENLEQPPKAGNQGTTDYLVDPVGQLQSGMGVLVQRNPD